MPPYSSYIHSISRSLRRRSLASLTTSDSSCGVHEDVSPYSVSKRSGECVCCFESTGWVIGPCGHSLCSACARRWFDVSETCPTCRRRVDVLVHLRPRDSDDERRRRKRKEEAKEHGRKHGMEKTVAGTEKTFAEAEEVVVEDRRGRVAHVVHSGSYSSLSVFALPEVPKQVGRSKGLRGSSGRENEVATSLWLRVVRVANEVVIAEWDIITWTFPLVFVCLVAISIIA